MTDAFSDQEFQRLLHEFETRLGYLKGVEEVWHWGEKVRKQAGDWADQNQQDPNARLEPWKWEAPRNASIPGVVKFELLVPPDDGNVHSQLGFAADQSFQNGTSWAQGIGDYLYSMCWFVRGDAGALARAASTLADLGFSLNTASAGEGLGGVLGSWHGEGKNAFVDFYTHVNDRIHTWGQYAVLAGAGVGVISNSVKAAKDELMTIATAASKAAGDQLDTWCSETNVPGQSGALMGPPWEGWDKAVDIAMLVGKWAALIPGPQQTLVTALNTLGGLAKDTDKAIEGDKGKAPDKTPPMKDAASLYKEVQHQIDRHCNGLADSLSSNVRDAKVQPRADDIASIAWYTNLIPGIRTAGYGDGKHDYSYDKP